MYSPAEPVFDHLWQDYMKLDWLNSNNSDIFSDFHIMHNWLDSNNSEKILTFISCIIGRIDIIQKHVTFRIMQIN